jgi:Tfp pilus assembly major pilin PilA
MATSEQAPRRRAARTPALRFVPRRRRRHRREARRPYANIVVVIAALGGLALLLQRHPSVRSDSAAATAESTGGTTAIQKAAHSAATPPTLPAPAAGLESRTVLGRAVNTDFGPMQVQVSLVNARITSTRAVQVTNAGLTSKRINDRSLPILNTEAIRTQSANIDAVTGATVTSNGYKQSLQSAIDLAHRI